MKSAGLAAAKFPKKFKLTLPPDNRGCGRWGKVCLGGKPQQRLLLTDSLGVQGTRSLSRDLLNQRACFDSRVNLDELKRYIASYKRLDVEQAAALAVCQLTLHQAAVALETVPTMLSTICMWREAADLEAPLEPAAASAERRMKLMRQVLEQQGLQSDETLRDLTAALMQVRRKRPKESNSQRLCLPERLLSAVELEPSTERGSWQESFGNGRQTELQAPSSKFQLKTVSKSIFTCLQTYLGRLAGDQSPAAQLNRNIRALQATIEKGANRFDALLATSDQLALVFSFMGLMRQRQLKVVSDNAWTTFLKKGGGVQVQQNTPHILTSFELALWSMAVSRTAAEVDWDALSAITTPNGPVSRKGEDVLDLIDQTCLLMEQYVLIHGHGCHESLTFQTDSQGGSGLGPVDSYNQLVDLLRVLKSRAEQAGQPVIIQPCYKFLAKDIMQWNGAWADDAFGAGRIPGWEGWLKDRRTAGALSNIAAS